MEHKAARQTETEAPGVTYWALLCAEALLKMLPAGQFASCCWEQTEDLGDYHLQVFLIRQCWLFNLQ